MNPFRSESIRRFFPYAFGLGVGLALGLLMLHEHEISERCRKRGGMILEGRCVQVKEIPNEP